MGLTSSIWGAALGFLVVPLYLRYLGIGAYGLIGFFATMQAILSLVDFGIVPTINREVARSKAIGVSEGLGDLLYMLERIYFLVGLVAAIGIIALSELIANHWLSSGELEVTTLRQAVILMGIVFACRWPIGLYQGALQGAQRISLISKINICVATINSLGAVTILAFISPTIEAFFIWQAIIAFATLLLMRKAAWGQIGPRGESSIHWALLKRIWKFSAGMTGVGLSGLMLMQLDKVLLSRLVSLEDFGVYALAGVVASGLYVFLTPLFNVIYPKMSELVAAGNEVKLISFYESSTRIFLSLFFPIVLTAIIFSKSLLAIWTGNADLAARATPVVQLILFGTALNGVMHFPYTLQLAFGKTKLPLFINLILLGVSVPLIILLTSHYGVIGGAAAWAILNTIYVLIGIWITHRSILIGLGPKWTLKDVGVPLIVSISVLVVGGQIIFYANVGEALNLFFGSILCVITIGLTLLFSKDSTNILLQEFHVYFRKSK